MSNIYHHTTTWSIICRHYVLTEKNKQTKNCSGDDGTTNSLKESNDISSIFFIKVGSTMFGIDKDT